MTMSSLIDTWTVTDPARVTALWMHTLPPKEKGKIKIHFDDGSGTIIETMPGKTAFIVRQLSNSFSVCDC